MKKLLLFIGILCINQLSFAQVKIDHEGGNINISDGIPVFQGKLNVSTQGRTFSFAFAQGDVVQIKFSTHKEKKLNQARFYNEYGRNLWQDIKIASANQQINITKEGIYTLELDGRGLGGRDVTLDIIRKPGSQKDFNTAWMKYSTYTSNKINYTVDSMIGYKKPIVTEKEMQLFDKYLYQEVEMYNHSTQILGKGGVHNSQAKGYKMDIDNTKVPKNGKLKGYTYSVVSKLGGAKHWVIADMAVSVGGMFLSPAAGFAAHGAMALIGPQPGREPVQYFMSNRESDLNIVKKIYSPSNKGQKILDKATGKSYAKNEGDLDYDQKGKITNLFVYSATPPVNKWFIMANPDFAHAKNVKFKGTAIYYAPKYNNLKAREYKYDLNTIQVKKSTLEYTRTASYQSIKN